MSSNSHFMNTKDGGNLTSRQSSTSSLGGGGEHYINAMVRHGNHRRQTRLAGFLNFSKQQPPPRATTTGTAGGTDSLITSTIANDNSTTGRPSRSSSVGSIRRRLSRNIASVLKGGGGGGRGNLSTNSTTGLNRMTNVANDQNGQNEDSINNLNYSNSSIPEGGSTAAQRSSFRRSSTIPLTGEEDQILLDDPHGQLRRTMGNRSDFTSGLLDIDQYKDFPHSSSSVTTLDSISSTPHHPSSSTTPMLVQSVTSSLSLPDDPTSENGVYDDDFEHELLRNLSSQEIRTISFHKTQSSNVAKRHMAKFARNLLNPTLISMVGLSSKHISHRQQQKLHNQMQKVYTVPHHNVGGGHGIAGSAGIGSSGNRHGVLPSSTGQTLSSKSLNVSPSSNLKKTKILSTVSSSSVGTTNLASSPTKSTVLTSHHHPNQGSSRRQYFTEGYTMDVNKLNLNQQISQMFEDLFADIMFRLRKYIPCCICKLETRVFLPTENTVEIFVTGMALSEVHTVVVTGDRNQRVVDHDNGSSTTVVSEKVGKTRRSIFTPDQLARLQIKTSPAKTMFPTSLLTNWEYIERQKRAWHWRPMVLKTSIPELGTNNGLTMSRTTGTASVTERNNSDTEQKQQLVSQKHQQLVVLSTASTQQTLDKSQLTSHRLLVSSTKRQHVVSTVRRDPLIIDASLPGLQFQAQSSSQTWQEITQRMNRMNRGILPREPYVASSSSDKQSLHPSQYPSSQIEKSEEEKRRRDEQKEGKRMRDEQKEGKSMRDSLSPTQPLLPNLLWQRAPLINNADVIELTPLSYLPRKQIQSYLGHLSMHFIKESGPDLRDLRDPGGLGRFFSTFISEVNAIVRSHVKSLGGNALVSYRVRPRASGGRIYRKQVYSVYSIAGDVVRAIEK
eukprot:g1051.t1